MDTAVRPTSPPPSLPHDPITQDPSHRRGRLALGVLAIGLSVVLTAGLFWASNVEPIASGSYGFDPLFGLPPELAEDARVQTIDAFGQEGTQLRVSAEPGDSFTYGFSIRNDGPVPIVVEGVGTGAADADRRIVRAIPDLTAPGRQTWQAFEPFAIQPDGEAGLEVEIRVPDDLCLVRGSIATWYEEQLRFSVMGIRRHQTVETGMEIGLLGTATNVC